MNEDIDKATSDSVILIRESYKEMLKDDGEFLNNVQKSIDNTDIESAGKLWKKAQLALSETPEWKHWLHGERKEGVEASYKAMRNTIIGKKERVASLAYKAIKDGSFVSVDELMSSLENSCDKETVGKCCKE